MSYGIALAKTAGRITLRLANAEWLPLDFVPWQKTVSGYLDEIVETTTAMRQTTEKHNELVRSKAYELSADPKKNLKAPELKSSVPYLDFSPLQNALAALEGEAESFSKIDFSTLPKSKRDTLNELLMKTEQQLTSPEGLPRRSWYKHQIYAPGFYTGYGVKTLPGVREAIEQRDWEEAQSEIEKLAGTLKSMANHLNGINAMN
jgi:N-acetylated-alpha-linked acidic dipeptidase